VLAAAATASQHQREELSRLVHNVSEAAEPPLSPPSEKPAEAISAKAVADVLDASSSSNSCSSSSSSPMTRITDTLKRLVSSGGSDIDPADYLNSEHVTRLDVSGFLALLREVGGPLVDQHMTEWAAVDLAEAEAQGESVRRRVAAVADNATPQAQQALGGARRLRETVRRRIALFPDATRTPLPNAPSTSMVCLYGIGLPTERGYHYLRPPPQGSPSTSAAATAAGVAGPHDLAAEAAAAISPTAGREGSTTAAPPSASGAGDAAAAAAAAGSDGGSGSTSSPPPPHNPLFSGEESSPESGSDASAGWMILKDVSSPGTSLVGLMGGRGGKEWALGAAMDRAHINSQACRLVPTVVRLRT
ncbi:hypothetical protein Vretifemale_7932, partial [Volvox reticuliferus]